MASNAGSSDAMYDLGVLFVHGIGAQERGVTLAEFGNPLVHWLRQRAASNGGEVQVASAVLAPSDGEPARTVLALRAGGTSRQWLMSEALWADAFAQPAFADMARWGVGVVPRTFGMHFGRQLARAWRAPSGTNQERVERVGGVAVALVRLLAGIALVLPTVGVLGALRLLGLIPWERLRSAIVRTQLRLASSIGDSFILVSQPLQSAAILTRFERELAWLGNRCALVAIVAHSQGAAVACRALARLPISDRRLLITFGSGLRKLAELEELPDRPHGRRGAWWTALGLPLCSLGLLMLPHWIANARRDPDALQMLGIMMIYIIGGGALLVAGIRDFVAVDEPLRLRRLAETLRSRVRSWLDVYASADPVPNGPVREGERPPDSSEEVTNTGSIFSDHTTYWRNRDEFVSLVGNALLGSDERLSALRLDGKTLEGVRARRKLRVRMSQVSWWLALAGGAAVVVRDWSHWQVVLGYGLRRTWRAVAGLAVQERLAVIAAPAAADWLHSLGWFAPVLLGYAMARGTWSRWNEREIAVPSAEQKDDGYIRYAVAIWGQVVLCGVALTHDVGLPWVLAGFGVMLPLIVISARHAPARSTEPAVREGRPEDTSTADQAASALRNIAEVLAMGLGLVLASTVSVRWVKSRLPSWAPDWGPDWLFPAVVIVVAGVVLFGLLWCLSWLVVRWRQSTASARQARQP